MPEFTGERVIPGLVDTDLLNEHMARYRFAARFATGRTVLDAGCGAGYGTVEFGDAASVTAIDISSEAVRLARAAFARPGVHFVQAECEALPFADESFELIAAFEVIEHLERWHDLLSEAIRVLTPSGILIVSTPNKVFYAESRAAAGRNPFHCHEFEHDEFEAVLSQIFPHVRIWTQNHAQTIVFAPANPTGATLEAAGDTEPENGNFFVAACSRSPIDSNEVYAWVPQSANLLRERQRHVVKLEGELAQKNVWLEQLEADHAKLQRAHENTLVELKERGEWAHQLNSQLEDRAARIIELQQEAEQTLEWIRQLQAEALEAQSELERLDQQRRGLESDVAARTEWARSIEAQLEVRTEHGRLLEIQIEEHERHLVAQAERLRDVELFVQHLRHERQLIASSKWIRLGRTLNLGPSVSGE